MDKIEHINYWLNSAKDDWEAVLDIAIAKRYVHSLFFAHLVLEKILKAHWVKDNEENHPPRIHNLIRLAAQTKLEIPDEMLIFMDKFNDFQLEGRYPDYANSIYKVANKEYTERILLQVESIRTWLLSKMPSV